MEVLSGGFGAEGSVVGGSAHEMDGEEEVGAQVVRGDLVVETLDDGGEEERPRTGRQSNKSPRRRGSTEPPASQEGEFPSKSLEWPFVLPLACSSR